eukprot:3913955-Rhodomonas_salina.1
MSLQKWYGVRGTNRSKVLPGAGGVERRGSTGHSSTQRRRHAACLHPVCRCALTPPDAHALSSSQLQLGSEVPGTEVSKRIEGLEAGSVVEVR